MELRDLLESAYCCDLKECEKCPSRSRTACRERTMHELALEVENLKKEIEHLKKAKMKNRAAKMEMADALRDLLTVCEHPTSEEARSEKAKKWRKWLESEESK